MRFFVFAIAALTISLLEFSNWPSPTDAAIAGSTLTLGVMSLIAWYMENRD